jgi:cytochrome P450
MHIKRLKEQGARAAAIVSDYVHAHIEDPELFPESYIAGLLPNFLYAGHETTTSQSGNALRILLENPTQWQCLCADPSVIPNAVEECIRAVSSVIAWRRLTKTAVSIGGVEIPAGAKLLIYSGAANRDPEVFESPEQFDLARDNAKRHISFGYGAHLCIGAPLARMELKVMLEELARRLPHMRLVAEQSWSYSANTSFRGPERLLVEWEPELNPVPGDRL